MPLRNLILIGIVGGGVQLGPLGTEAANRPCFLTHLCTLASSFALSYCGTTDCNVKKLYYTKLLTGLQVLIPRRKVLLEK
jgi:hypothetical protein